MLPDIGNLMLILIIVLSAIVSILPFFKPLNNFEKILKLNTTLVFILSAICLILLVVCFAKSDFSVLIVANHSHTLNPLIYKISAAWGNHEGSMLLWLLCMSFYQMLYTFLGHSQVRDKLIANSIQSSMIMLFTAFIAVASNPFTRIFPAPNEGLGFNPILQDIGLAMHPPVLYLGYVGSSMVFSIITAALFRGAISNDNLKDLKFVTLIFWVFLTLGISLGSWWAYRELGWGGYWFWDPVENASLMPWLSATALFHSIVSANKNYSMKIWIIILSLITFLLSVMGTFLVRSGLLTSVHSFAVDAERGLFILGLFTILTLGSLILFAIKAEKFASHEPIELRSKTAMILFQNIAFSLMLFVVFIATLYPLINQIFSQNAASIGVGYYNFFNKITVTFLLIFCIFGHVLKWTKTDLKVMFFNNKFSLLLSLFIGVNLIFIFKIYEYFSGGIIFLCLVLTILTIKSLVSKIKNFKISQTSSLFGHLGFALLVVGIALNQYLQFDVQQITKINGTLEAESYTLVYKDINHLMMENYLARRAQIQVLHNKKFLGVIEPELRLYPIEQQTTVEAAIITNKFDDVYVVIGDMNEDKSLNITCYIRPFVKLIWFSCFLLVFGGIISVLRLTSSRINGRKLQLK